MAATGKRPRTLAKSARDDRATIAAHATIAVHVEGAAETDRLDAEDGPTTDDPNRSIRKGRVRGPALFLGVCQFVGLLDHDFDPVSDDHLTNG